MAQRGVTLAEVETAIDTLRSSGQSVSARSVRHALGDRGSLTTLATHLRTIRAREDEQRILAGAALGPALPDPVIQGLMLGARKHWDELNDAADAIVDQARTEAAGRVQAARDAAQAATTEAAAARSAQATAATALAETQAELEALRTAHAALGEEHRSLAATQALTLERQRGAESLAEERRASLKTVTARLERTTTELGDARDALERARTEADARERGLMGRLAAEEGKRRDAEQALHTQGERAERRRASTRAGAGRGECDRPRARRDPSGTRCRARRARRHGARSRNPPRALRRARHGTLRRAGDHARSLAAMLERATERAAAAEAALRAAQAAAARERPDSDDGRRRPPPSVESAGPVAPGCPTLGADRATRHAEAIAPAARWSLASGVASEGGADAGLRRGAGKPVEAALRQGAALPRTPSRRTDRGERDRRGLVPARPGVRGLGCPRRAPLRAYVSSTVPEVSLFDAARRAPGLDLRYKRCRPPLIGRLRAS